MKTIFQTLNDLKNEVKETNLKEKILFLEDSFRKLRTKTGLKGLIRKKKLRKILKEVEYEEELQKLQIELIKLQNWAYENKKRVMIIFEGRDAAGKGGAIKRFTEHLNPRKYRVVALPKPTEVETGQFYFQRYFKHLPDPGEIVFFDRSWYNRAIVEPVFGFCTKEQYDKFIKEVPEIEHALIDDGIIMIKFWFSISKETQKKRFEERMKNPLKQWKLSPVDKKAQKLWDKITYYKEEMFSKTHTSYSPWIIVNSNDKKTARLESIRYVLSQIDYDGKEKSKVSLHPDPDIVQRYHRKNLQID
ncbi:polyphosphate kinase 2 [Caminibacter pacificus]|uniref:ADP/GDP-polyphosphate phosphotransferase n=1 Tax=Caminibacter pacificus TaxID=1424653 RepID=A0AAJ4REC4_9BACT|nr:polyphosphate kinase 2 [Caminibacter pacificus]QCI28247.1 polyphosphate kinase 2 [Caminibacter pacificus]ROR41039.1 polyphosphate kinase 2 [Caminibacter pacificus]